MPKETPVRDDGGMFQVSDNVTVRFDTICQAQEALQLYFIQLPG